MFLKNNSTKIIGIGEMSILPEETKKCPEGYEKNPVILRYIKNGTFTKIEDVSDANGNNDVDMYSASTDKRLEEMTEEELIRYAVENSIDIGKATTREGILKKIQDAMS